MSMINKPAMKSPTESTAVNNLTSNSSQIKPLIIIKADGDNEPPSRQVPPLPSKPPSVHRSHSSSSRRLQRPTVGPPPPKITGPIHPPPPSLPIKPPHMNLNPTFNSNDKRSQSGSKSVSSVDLTSENSFQLTSTVNIDDKPTLPMRHNSVSGLTNARKPLNVVTPMNHRPIARPPSNPPPPPPPHRTSISSLVSTGSSVGTFSHSGSSTSLASNISTTSTRTLVPGITGNTRLVTGDLTRKPSAPSPPVRNISIAKNNIETRFKSCFKDIHLLPAPEPFLNTKKTYLNNSKRGPAPPPPTQQQQANKTTSNRNETNTGTPMHVQIDNRR